MKSASPDIAALESILIVKPSSLGDIVHTLPLLPILKQHAPQARLSWVVNSVWAPLLQDHPLLDEVIEFPRHEFKGPGGLLRFQKWMSTRRDARPDLCIDVQGLLRSALIARAHRPARILGYSDSREGAGLFHHESIPVAEEGVLHAVDRYLSLCSWLCVDLPEPVEFPLPEGTLPANVEIPEGAIVLHPFSRGKGKSLTVSQVESLMEALEGRPLILVGRAEEAASLRVPDGVINLLNQTSIPELIGILRRAHGVISVDSGPMHLAAALTDRLLSLHTWSNPLRVGPWNPDAWAWKHGEIRRIRDWKRQGPADEARGSSEFPDHGIQQVADHVIHHW